MAVYLLLYDRPTGSEKHSASHYLGYASDDRLESRLKEHATGKWMELGLSGRKAPALPAAMFKQGIPFRVVWVEIGPEKDRHYERRIKKRKEHHKLYWLDDDGENGTSRDYAHIRALSPFLNGSSSQQ
jgi:predicted GIY-YIG superfamily endonuclease